VGGGGGGGECGRGAGGGGGGGRGVRGRGASVGQDGGGALRVASGKAPQAYCRAVDAGTAVYRELYWRGYLKNQPGWVGGGADKLSRAMSLASSSSWAQAMIAHVWSGTTTDQTYLRLDPASGTGPSGKVVA